MNTDKIESASIKGPAEPGEEWVVRVNGQEFKASTQTGSISAALESIQIPTTKENILTFIDLAVQGVNPPEVSRTDIPPAKPVKKRKAKPEKKPEDEFVDKVYLGKKGEIVRVVNVTPPGEWQFQVQYLSGDEFGEFGVLSLKEFKELIELVPKRSRRGRGKNKSEP